MLKKFIKLNNMLDNYHLFLDVKEYKLIGWRLYKKYDDPKMYSSVENEPIMTSEESSYKDLVKFAKKHKKYDIPRTLLKTNVYISIIVLIICLLNIFFGNEWIRGFILGADLMLITSSTMIGMIEERNFKVSLLEYEEEQSKNKVEEETI